MKKIIYVFGILFLAIIVIVNVLFTSNLDALEHSTINWNSFAYIAALALVGGLIYFITRIVDKHLYIEDNDKKRKLRKILLIISLVIYIAFAITWVVMIRPFVVGDQIHTCNLAQTFYRGNEQEFLPNITYAGIPLSEYMQAYQQQITLAFIFNIFFRIIHFDVLESLRGFNVIGVLLIIFALYKIVKHLSKEYKTNKVLFFTLILTFISLPMLSTFIYGDIISLAFCLLSVYFTMKYAETKKWQHIIISAIFIAIAYMARMNSLIFIIATIMYLLLNMFKDINKKIWKENALSILMVGVYIIIAIAPASIVKTYYLNKYNLDKTKGCPSIRYIYMAMEEGPRANGWYSEEIGEYTLRNPESSKQVCMDKIKERLTYFTQNPKYAFEFYTDKITSMWAENTYAAVRNNMVQEDDKIENMIAPLTFYQKALLIITCLCSLIVLIQNRKKLSLEVIFLVTIFIGGFAFHILWEAKSRYIIPYIVVLIPIASIYINKWKFKNQKNTY